MVRYSYNDMYLKGVQNVDQSQFKIGETLSIPPKNDSKSLTIDNHEEILKELATLTYENKKLTLVNQLVAGLAHEIRNPLTIMKGFLQLIKPDLDRLQKSDIADLLLSEIHRTNGLIEEFLNVTRPREQTLEKVSIVPFLRNILLLYQSEATINKCTLSTNLQHLSQPSFAMIDSGQLKQVFLNMVKNSIEAIRCANRDNGYISLSVFRRLHTIDIHIRDNGIGMDETTKSKLFQPFFTTKKKGTGLGLFLCKQIIQNHRGTIEVNSTPMLGTTFMIQLPIISAD